MTPDEIGRMRFAIMKWDWEERDQFLKDHFKVLIQKNEELYMICEEATGHDFKYTNNNGLGYNFYNCRYCKKSKSEPDGSWSLEEEKEDE